jgi:hypothetical protein
LKSTGVRAASRMSRFDGVQANVDLAEGGRRGLVRREEAAAAG